MTDEQARRIANVVVAAAAAGAAYYILTTPRLRRMAWALLVTAATSTAPSWFATELRQAWAESGARHRDIITG